MLTVPAKKVVPAATYSAYALAMVMLVPAAGAAAIYTVAALVVVTLALVANKVG